VLGIAGPDPRLRDIELLLRLVAWRMFSREYTGNLKQFLDDAMKKLNASWDSQESATEKLVAQIFLGIKTTLQVFSDNAGRKYKNGKFESLLNRALFEVQVYYFSMPSIREAVRRKRKDVSAAFKILSADDEFKTSIEATTKSIENYRVRFGKYRAMLRNTLGVEPTELPLGHKNRHR
jgi:hypothetical protein